MVDAPEYEVRSDKDGEVEAAAFMSSTSGRFTAKELEATGRWLAWTVRRAADGLGVRVFEVPCPCCECTVGPDDFLNHVVSPPWFCDRERWGCWGEAVDHFDDDELDDLAEAWASRS